MVATAVLALAVAFVPRRRSPERVAALAAAILVALQLTAEHWFYLYIVWFFPALLVALTAPAPGSRTVPPPGAETTDARRVAGVGAGPSQGVGVSQSSRR